MQQSLENINHAKFDGSYKYYWNINFPYPYFTFLFLHFLSLSPSLFFYSSLFYFFANRFNENTKNEYLFGFWTHVQSTLKQESCAIYHCAAVCVYRLTRTQASVLSYTTPLTDDDYFLLNRDIFTFLWEHVLL